MKLRQSTDQAESIVKGIRRHPRCVHQALIQGEDQLKRLRDSLPRLVPYQRRKYAGFLPILDWDHHLPTRTITLRIYAYYKTDAMEEGEGHYVSRCRQIEARDRFPEFDVPDFADLPADEAYEVVLEENGEVSQIQLSSEWRRNIEQDSATKARNVVRKSEEYKRISQDKNRPDFLGDLEARSWTPPCEGGHDRWTVDVWYLLEYNGMMGKGLSFLVDLESKKVVNVREFVLRSQ